MIKNIPCLTIHSHPKLFITVLTPEQVNLLNNYEIKNKLHLLFWEPTRNESYFSKEKTEARLINTYQNFFLGSAIHFAVLNQNDNTMIASCNFTNIIYRAFQACHLGFSIDSDYQGQGIMYAVINECIQYVFTTYKLHRVMANYIKTNKRSENLLKRLTFEQEGIAKSYLKINGSWQDHVLTSKINPLYEKH